MRQPTPNIAAGAVIHRAIELLNAGKKCECLDCLRRLNVQGETSHLICNLAGLVCLSLSQYPLALERFGRALTLFPAYSDALANRGLALHKLGRYAEALAAYDQALEAGCAKPELLYNRGNILRESGRLAEAIASYDRALRIAPAYPEALRAGASFASSDVAKMRLSFLTRPFACVWTSLMP
jgi:tetratricopeptide (TPR) repeat protein